MKIKSIVYSLFILIIFCLPSTATTYFVSQSGGSVSCGVDGTQSTIAIGTLSGTQWTAGNTIKLCGTITTSLTAQGNGSVGNLISVVFENGSKISLGACGSTGCINLVGRSYILVDGGTNGLIEATNSGTGLGNSDSNGVYCRSGCSHVEVKNLTINNMYVHTGASDNSSNNYYAIWLDGTNNLIHNNTIRDALAGIKVEAGSSGNQFYNNIIHNSNWGIFESAAHLVNSITNELIYGNEIYDFANWDTTADTFHHDGIFLSGNSATTDLTHVDVYNNYVHGTSSSSITCASAPGNGSCMTAYIYINTDSNVRVFNNLLVANNGDTGPNDGWIFMFVDDHDSLLNNTVIGGSEAGSPTAANCILLNSGTNYTFENNVLSHCNNLLWSTGSSTFTILDYNIYQATTLSWRISGTFYSSIAAWRTGSSGDTHGQALNGSLNFDTNQKPEISSIVIKAAINLTSLGITSLNADKASIPRPPTGNWDTGAYSFVSPINSLCSPPFYCANQTLTTIQTPPSPFTTSTLTNSTAIDPISGYTILRMTDPNTGGGICNTNNQFISTPSGGSNDVISNVDTTLYIATCSGGGHWLQGFNPYTFKVFPVPPAALLSLGSGEVGASRLFRQILYAIPKVGDTVPGGTPNGTTLYKITLPLANGTNLCGRGIGSCPDPSGTSVWTPVFDFGTCSQAPVGTPLSGSFLGIGINDSNFTVAKSWTGGQDTARYFFAYVPGIGCYTLDTVGNGTNPVWYTPSGVPTTINSVNISFTIHDAYSLGPYAPIAIGNTCTGLNCPAADGQPIWQVGTSNLIIMGDFPHSSGHSTSSPSWYYSSPNPPFYKLQITNPTNAIQYAATNCTPSCQDWHGVGDVNTDINSILGTTGGFPNATWTAPYKNEILGFNTNGTGNGVINRFAKTYSTGTTATNFWAQFAIGGASQDRTTYFWTTDMLGGLGIVPSGSNAGKNRWDIFALRLAPPSSGVVGQELFGFTENNTNPSNFPTVTYKMQRFWDSPPLQWPSLNTSSGVFNFTALDTILAQDFTNGVNIGFYTLARTPQWASSNPTDTMCHNQTGSGGGHGECYPPIDLNADGSGTNAIWKAWITAIATHVNNPSYLLTHAHIKYWEIWNEPDNKPFWAGSFAQLARLTEDANCIITGRGVIHPNGNGTSVPCAAVAIDPTAVIVMSSGHAATTGALTYSQNQLYCSNPGGAIPYQLPCPNPPTATSAAVDIINFHMKPGVTSSDVEGNFITYVNSIHGILQPTELVKPLWDGESAYSDLGFVAPYNDADMAASLMPRMYLTMITNGISGSAWYTWDNIKAQNAKVATSYQQTYNYLNGATVFPLCTNTGTVWSCGLVKGSSTYLVLWDTSKTCSSGTCPTGNVSVPTQWGSWQDMTSVSTPTLIVSNTVPVGIKPIILTVGSGGINPGVSPPSSLNAIVQ